MTLLVWVTLAYTAVLVLVLAAGLTTIWVQLRSIDGNLTAARDSLVRVIDEAAPLEEGITPVREGILEGTASLQRAAAELSAAREAVEPKTAAAAAGRGE